MATCTSIRDSVARYLSGNVRLTESMGKCLITLPVTTPKNRRVTLIVEDRFGMFLVHDAGKTLGELFSMGINLTESVVSFHAKIADSYGVRVKDGLAFQALCKKEELEKTVWQVAQCALMVSRDMVGHQPSPLEDTVSSKIGKILDAWMPPYIEAVERNANLKGAKSEHRFNFLTHPRRGELKHPVAIKLLPSTQPYTQAKAFAFASIDLEKSSRTEGLKKLAIVTNGEVWKNRSRALVKTYSDASIFLKTSEWNYLPTELASYMDSLSTGALLQ